MKHPHCSLLGNIDMEQQQQSLFDVSIIKLQHEQLRHGVEPRLLRFVLINNALRSLQDHMLHMEDDETLAGIAEDFQCETSDLFFYNTFKNGRLSSSGGGSLSSPPTPAKVMKLDTAFGDQHPLVEFQEATLPALPSSSMLCGVHDATASSSSSSTDETRVHTAACFDVAVAGCGSSISKGSDEGGGGAEGGGGGVAKDRQLPCNGICEGGYHLGKRSREKMEEGDVGEGVRGGGYCLPEHGGGQGLRGLMDEDSTGGGNGGGESKRTKLSSTFPLNGVQKMNGTTLNSLSSTFNVLYSALDLDPFPSLSFTPSPSPSSPLSPHHHHTHHHHHHHSNNSSSSPHNNNALSSEEVEEREKDSLTIDFTNVDTTLYDFDTATAVLQVGNASDGSSPTSDLNDSLPQHHHHHQHHQHHQQLQQPAHSSSSSTSPLSALTAATTATSSFTMETTSALPLYASLDQAIGKSEEQETSGNQRSGDTTGRDDPSNIAATTTTTSLSYPEGEKISVLSANSTVVTSGPVGVQGKGAATSCSIQAIRAAQNNGDLLGSNNEEEEEEEREEGSCNGGPGTGRVTSLQERVAETDYLDDIEHIVELLMT